jgi:hypothetical protein
MVDQELVQLIVCGHMLFSNVTRWRYVSDCIFSQLAHIPWWHHSLFCFFLHVKKDALIVRSIKTL